MCAGAARAAGARALMEFKLNLDNGHANVPTDAYTMAEARAAAARARSARKRRGRGGAWAPWRCTA